MVRKKVLFLLTVAVLILAPMVRTRVLASDLRTWLATPDQVDLSAHGCQQQAEILNTVQDAGGKIVALAAKRMFLAWFPPGWETSRDRRLVMTLHGSGGCAERMFNFWHRNAPLHNFAIISIQYAQTDASGTTSYDDSRTIYSLLRETAAILRRHGVLSGTKVVLHGFSKGSGRIFELAALDRAPEGMHLFAAFIADSGTGFPDHGGRLSPLLHRLGPRGYEGARFWLYCGSADHEGRTCRGMQRMASFIRAHGGIVDAIYRYQGGGHGIFLTGGPRRPSRALDDLFSYINSLGNEKKSP